MTIPTVPSGVVPPPVSHLIRVHVVPHAASSLPFTGADFKELAILGTAAVLGGLALKFRRRQARA